MNLNLLTKGPMPVPKSLKKNGVKGGKKKVIIFLKNIVF